MRAINTSENGEDGSRIHDRLLYLVKGLDDATGERRHEDRRSCTGIPPQCCRCRRASIGKGIDGLPYCRACMPKRAA